MTPDRTQPPADHAVHRALRYLAAQQLRSGQFPIEATLHFQDGAPVVADASPFTTTHIVHSLGHLPATVGDPLITPALRYIRAEMSPFGLWRYWNRDAVWIGHRIRSFIPADLDDTANNSQLLREHGVPIPDNRMLLLGNRDRQGRFFTWFVPRLHWNWSPRYWGAILSELTVPRLTTFWTSSEAGYGDVDGVVNANVLLYLGAGPETQPVVAWLRSIIQDGHEATCDKWYRDQFTFHYAVSRCHHAGIPGFGDLATTVHDRLAALAAPDGQIGESALHTALAACTLLNYGLHSPLLDRAIAALLQCQDDDGSWPSAPFYYGGPRRVTSWGSRALTTGFCLEAIHRAIAGGAASV